MELAKSQIETLSPDSFVADSIPLITHSETVLTGQTIAARVPLGRVTVSGKLIESKSDASDGSDIPVAISVHDIDTTGADAKHPVYKGGGFDSTKIVWDASWTVPQKSGAFDRTPIIQITPV